ncbi:MAG: apolipoprotein N-acyltransferase [Rickettsiales bacterium]
MSAKILSRLEGVSGKTRAFMLAAFGAFATLSLPPYHCLFAGAAGFSLFFLACFSGETTAKRGFKDGMAFGYGFFLAGLYWIAVALTVETERFFWLIPVAVLGIPLVMSQYAGIAGAACGGFSAKYRGFCGRLVVFIGCWTALEWLRGALFSGFPWNLVGYSLASSPALLQTASLGGIWALSALALILFLLPAALAGVACRRASIPLGLALIACALGAAGGACVYGKHRLEANPTRFVPDVKLRVVQPNIPQTLKWDPKERYGHLQLLRQLSETSDPKVKYVLWPESAMPYMMTDNMEAAEWMAESAPFGGGVIAGAVRGKLNESGRIEEVRNSVVVVDRAGRVVDYYDKSHLVPFGEYVPLRRIFPFISKITDGLVDFSAGDGPRTVRVPGVPPFSPLVCYEIIFPGRVALRGGNRPNFIVNVTNDAWYGHTSGPYQHFAAAIVRAVEEGLPVVRAANNGISGVIDPLGRVREKTELGTRGIMDIKLPEPLDAPPLFARMGR